MTRARHALAIAALFFTGLATGDVAAGETPPAESSSAGGGAPHAPAIVLSASPMFGNDAAAGDGWMEIVVRVDDVGTSPAKGTIELVSTMGGYYGGRSPSDVQFTARAPFHVMPHTGASIRMPLRAVPYVSPTVVVVARGDGGAELASATLSITSNVSPLLVDVDQPSRLSIVMRAWPMSPTWHPGWAGPYGYVPGMSGTPLTLTVGSPGVDPTTGDPVLPEHAAAYSAVNVVVIHSDRLARLDGSQLDALVGWVLSGGTLAVVPARPEDLRGGLLTTMAGGTITTAAAPPIMMTLPGASRSGGAIPIVPTPVPTPSPWMPSPPAGSDAGAATPISFHAPVPSGPPATLVVPVRTTPLGPGTTYGPSAALKPKLLGYAGGNLLPSAYGATAAYGLGQVHVLGFDPTAAPAIEDPWTHARIVDMVSDAWDRRALFVFPNGAGVQRATNLYDVHRALDPNENFRPALGIAAILLVLYSIAAGPLTFMRAHKRGRPLDPLVWAPVASAACFALIVLLGLAGKGWGGRARHLALAEAGAGMSRGSVRRFRGFFTSQTRAMKVRASEHGSVLDLVTADSRSQDAALHLDKDGAYLEDLTSLPWQTVVVSEDGFTDLGGGVAVSQKPDASVVVANHTGHEIRNVVVWAPKKEATWFASIDDGATVASTSGRSLFSPASRNTSTAGSRVVHTLDTWHFSSVLSSKVADEMSPAWSAMAEAAGSGVDWWPDDVPVVMGEISGGEGAKSDGGLRVESDRLLFRVIGEGGAT